ncbi:MAG TPA: hypothetical protein VGU02_11095 [Gaiellaceae bacterium]|nr:hypothetical protein [Gaiellaceae bacterium]
MIGFAGAAISAMLLLASLSTAGIGTYLQGELPRVTSATRTPILAGVAAAGAFGGVIGLAGGLATGETARLALLRSGTGLPLFAAGVACTAVAMVADQAALGLWHGRIQFWRNTAFSVCKLVLVGAAWLIGFRSGLALFSTWWVSTALSLTIPLAYGRRRGFLRHSATASWRAPSVLPLRSLAANHAFNLALQAPALLMPVLVPALLTLRDNATFFVSWQICYLVFMVPISLSSALYAVAAAAPRTLRLNLQRSLGASLLLCACGAIVVFVAGHWILEIFGHSYANNGLTPLRLLVVAAIPQVIKAHYVAVKRVHRGLVRALPIVGIGLLLEVGCAVAGAAGANSLAGFVVGWVVGSYLEGALMFPSVVTALRAS